MKFAPEALEFALVLLPLAVLVATGRRHAPRTTARTAVELVDRHERFLDGASHELRTPLTIARGHLELLQRRQGETSDLSTSLDALARIEQIVDSLLHRAAAPPVHEAATKGRLAQDRRGGASGHSRLTTPSFFPLPLGRKSLPREAERAETAITRW